MGAELRIPAVQPLPNAGAGQPARALVGWMEREEAVRFLTEDCVFGNMLGYRGAEELWEASKATKESLGAEKAQSLDKLPLSEADLKAARRFRSKHPGASEVVDFTRLSPADLVVHQWWISTAGAAKYRNSVTPDRWRYTALVDPPSNSDLKWARQGNTILCDVPHPEYLLAGPCLPDGQLKVVEAPGFVTVAFHAGRALLLTGYHRTYACTEHIRETPNAPRGVLFGVSNQLSALGEDARDILDLMETPRPPRMADFFDDRLALTVLVRDRRYRMKIHFDVAEVKETDARLDTITLPPPAPTRTESGTGDVSALIQLAAKYQDEGKTDDLIATYRQIVFLRPDHSVAHNNLGAALAKQGQTEQALEHFQRAFTLDPGNLDACGNIGDAFLVLGDTAAAAEYFGKALAINPRHAPAHNSLGVLLRNHGKFDGAKKHFETAIASNPSFPYAWYNHAEINTFRRGDAQLAAMESLASSGNLSNEGAALIHFALAKGFDDTGDYGRAFEHLRKANSLRRQELVYDEAAYLEHFVRIAEVCGRDLLESFEGWGSPSRVPIFIVGMPRSGSTLVEQILASHPQIQAAGESRELEKLAGSRANRQGSSIAFPQYLRTLDRAAVRELGEAYIRSLPACPDGVTCITDKLPGNFIYIGLIRTILPNARIIHTVRDPVETCMSCYSKPFDRGHHFSYDLGELGRYYRGYHELMKHWKSVLPAGVMLEVSYEDVVKDLDGQARRLIEYCGLDWDDRCLAFHKHRREIRTASVFQVRQPLYRSSLDRWRRYEAAIGPLLHELRHLTAGSSARAGAEGG